VRERDEPPDECEGEPRQEEAEREHQEGPSPLDVHQGREDVLQVAQLHLGDAALEDVALAILEDGPPAEATECAVVTPASAATRANTSFSSFNFIYGYHFPLSNFLPLFSFSYYFD